MARGGGLSASTHALEKGTKPTIDDLIGQLASLASPDKKDEAQHLVEALQQALQSLYKVGSLPLASLRKVVAEEVKAAIAAQKPTTLEPKTWATVASQGLPQPLATQPKKVVPARLQKEILVRAVGHTASQTKRTPQEVVQAIN